jgi:anti-sigma regulatory factor (Ser/Thr protein kinase)
VHVLQSIVEVLGARVGLDEIATNRLALAVDELYANIAKHGYHGKPGPVEFEAHIHRESGGIAQLHFEFRDHAPAIKDKEILNGRDINDVAPGGLGMHLICSVMDEVQHEALPDGNRWHLVANIKTEALYEHGH